MIMEPLFAGMKMLVEQIRLLRAQGHWVGAVLRSGSAPRAMPPWADAEADLDVASPSLLTLSFYSWRHLGGCLFMTTAGAGLRGKP